MKLFRIFIIWSIIFYSFNAFADPAPFGIEINKTTLYEIKSKFRIISTSNDKVPGYQYSLIDYSNLNTKGLSFLKIINDDQGIVRGVDFVIKGLDFDKLCDSIKSKYSLISKNNNRAWFENGKTQISIEYNNGVSYIFYEQQKYKALNEQRLPYISPKDIM